jgi:hypothetical protein
VQYQGHWFPPIGDAFGVDGGSGPDGGARSAARKTPREDALMRISLTILKIFGPAYLKSYQPHETSCAMSDQSDEGIGDTFV